MRRARIAELKNNLSRYLDLVRRGEVVQVLDRDVPVAEIVPLADGRREGSAGDELLRAMERKGLVRRGTGTIDDDLLRRDPPGRKAGVLASLLTERREGR